MRVATSIVRGTLQEAAEAAQAAEAVGYDSVLSMENQHEPFLPMAAACLRTERIELGTAVAIAFPRSPMVVAHTAHDLQTASSGRFVLGLGSQVKGHNERRFSVPWSAPAPRLKEYVQALREIWRCWEYDEPLHHEGEHYRFTLMPPNFKPPANGLPMVPVTIAAVGAAMLRVAGEICDGVRLHPFCTRRYLENVVVPELANGFGRGKRNRAHFEVSGGGFVATGADDATVAAMVEFVRARVAFYGSTRTYWPVLEQHGLEDLGAKLHQMSVAGEWNEMAAEVDDDTVHLFAAVGRYDEIAAAVEERFGGVSDTVSETALPNGTCGLPPDLIQDIRRIPATFQGWQSEQSGRG